MYIDYIKLETDENIRTIVNSMEQIDGFIERKIIQNIGKNLILKDEVEDKDIIELRLKGMIAIYNMQAKSNK